MSDAHLQSKKMNLLTENSIHNYRKTACTRKPECIVASAPRFEALLTLLLNMETVPLKGGAASPIPAVAWLRVASYLTSTGHSACAQPARQSRKATWRPLLSKAKMFADPMSPFLLMMLPSWAPQCKS